MIDCFFNLFNFYVLKESITNAKVTTTNLYKLIAVTKTTPQQLLMKKVIFNTNINDNVIYYFLSL